MAGNSKYQELLLLASLTSIQLARCSTQEELELLAAFFTVLGDSLALLTLEPPCSSPGT